MKPTLPAPAKLPLLLAAPLFAQGLFAQDPTQPTLQDPERLARRAALARAAQPPATGAGLSQGGLPQPMQGQGSGFAGFLNLLDVSLDVMTSVGSSTERNESLLDLQGGNHDARQRGFTLQQAEIQINGAVDPFFRGQFVLVSFLDGEGETVVEVEEAWLTSQQLPWNLNLKAGHYLTEFGRINPVHPHAWDFSDQPIVSTRFFGGDGLRAPGARLGWLAPTPTYFEFMLGVQNASGETTPSFLANDEVYEERPIGGRVIPDEPTDVRTFGDMLWHARIASAVDFGPSHTLGGGASAVLGPNATGTDATTVIWGADVMYRWRPVDNRRGYPFFKLQGEVMFREFEAAEQSVEEEVGGVPTTFSLPGETLDDWGGYLYAVWGFDVAWAVGMRGEVVGGSGSSYRGEGVFDRAQDPYRADRYRLSPMLSYQTSEYSRVRLQYNFDDSDHLEKDAHSLWLNFEILIGPHQPHAY